MKLAVVGLGQAGGKITDRFLEWDRKTGGATVRAAVVVNTAQADLAGLRHVPAENRVLIGQSRVKGHGVGADNELGAEIAEADLDEIQGAIDAIPVHDVDAFLLVAGLGGGTGSGAAPVVARYVKRIVTEPVYGLGVLPAPDEGGIYTLNAARSFLTLVDAVDNLLVFDNDAWRTSGESVQESYEAINGELVRRLGLLFSAGELADGQAVAESVVDASEIINTLSGGGVSTIGFAVEPLERRKEGLLGRKRVVAGDAVDATNRITSLVRKATLGRLTLPCDVAGAERALLVVAGPPDALSRKGVERGRAWLEEELGSMEVRGGDYPIPESSFVGAVVLIAGVTSVPRIKELQGIAIEAQGAMAEIRARSEESLASLVDDGEGKLQPLF